MTDLTSPQSKAITDKLATQHPLHQMMGEVFEELGGKEFLLEWAEDNPGEFMKALLKLAPAALPKGQTGSLHLHVHQSLQPGALDGEAVDVTPQGE